MSAYVAMNWEACFSPESDVAIIVEAFAIADITITPEQAALAWQMNSYPDWWLKVDTHDSWDIVERLKPYFFIDGAVPQRPKPELPPSPVDPDADGVTAWCDELG